MNPAQNPDLPPAVDPDDRVPPDDDAVPLESQIAVLEAELAGAQQAAAAARDELLRAHAELDNTRRRLEREAQKAARFATEELLRELLAVADALDLGVQAAERPDAQVPALRDGMQLTQRQLAGLLEKQGVKALSPQGEAFNPELHQAMSLVESPEVPPQHVLAVMQKGYQLHERLLRPAMVVVAKTPSSPPDGAA